MEAIPDPESRTVTSTPSNPAVPVLISKSRAPSLDTAHRLDGIDDQVEDDLLELDPISFNERQVVRELRPHRRRRSSALRRG